MFPRNLTSLPHSKSGHEVILSAVILTLVVTIAMNVLVSLFEPLGGIMAILLGGGIATVGLGAAISFLYGAPLKTATWISLVFLVVCIALSIGIQLLFRM
jgi:hypothetical protein